MSFIWAERLAAVRPPKRDTFQLGLIESRDVSLRGESKLGDKRQLGSLQLRLGHIHIQGCIEKVWIVIQGFLNKSLELGIREQTPPGDVGKAGRIPCNERIAERKAVAEESACVHRRPLILPV